MKALVIVIKKRYFDDIQNGIKPEEYRIIKPFWESRLIEKKTGKDKEYDCIRFIAGHRKNSPEAYYKYEGYERKEITHEFFGPEPVNVFAIKIGPKVDLIKSNIIYCSSY